MSRTVGVPYSVDLANRLQYQLDANALMADRGAAEMVGQMFTSEELHAMEIAFDRGFTPDEFVTAVLKLRAPKPVTMRAPIHESPSYRTAMIDAGRGHLLR